MYAIKTTICWNTLHGDLLDSGAIFILRPYLFLLYHAALLGVIVLSRSNLWEFEAGVT